MKFSDASTILRFVADQLDRVALLEQQEQQLRASCQKLIEDGHRVIAEQDAILTEARRQAAEIVAAAKKEADAQ
jgi:predicted Rossmann fold nucleotide-binding protein DprA/Smf involved in DNA uptake